MKQFEDFPDAENVNLLFVWATPDEMKLFRLEQDGLICIKEYGKINPLNSETMSGSPVKVCGLGIDLH